MSDESGVNDLGEVEICEYSDSESDYNIGLISESAECEQLGFSNIQSVISTSNKKLPTRLITETEACDLKMLFFGNTSITFDPEWHEQAFVFNPALSYGLLQHKGGPCGLLSAVQAHLIRQLLFDKRRTIDDLSNDRAENVPLKQPSSPTNQGANFSPSKLLNTPEPKRRQCLIQALAHILWQAGDHQEAVVAAPSSRQISDVSDRLYKDGIVETLLLTRFSKLEDLEKFFLEQSEQLESPGSCVCFLYSTVLSRGVERIKNEMDDPSNCLIGHHGYCTQEMVNLFLVGRAVSNVFDHEIVLCQASEEASCKDSGGGRLVLSGLNKQSDIGFLSLFEHYDSCTVGKFYKCPVYPIWVVLSESHFTIVFALKEEVAADGVASSKDDSTGQVDLWAPFDLYYYDTLGKQDTEISLNISPPNSNSDKELPEANNDKIPPLEHCIRTKWKNAIINWHGLESSQ